MGFLDASSNAVTDMLDGLIGSVPHLNRLDGFPEVKVVYDKAVDGNKRNERVAVISGGGSGHEPAHSGFVGPGMLTAAVCGDVFASPASAAVLAAIRHVTGPQGALLIVKNYTGDRLHFGIAAEKAKAEGLKVNMVVVGDDCALEGRGIAGRRGIAGTVLVHKVAGAAAAAGATLDQVTAEAQAAATSVGTVGVAATACTLPGSKPLTRIPKGKLEFGLGIHGEPGSETIDVMPVDGLVAKMMDTIAGRKDGREDTSLKLPHLKLSPGSQVALLVNSLGATTHMELLVAANAARRYASDQLQVDVRRLFVGHFMTALNMEGFSLSILDLNDVDVSRLDAVTKAPGWPCHMDMSHANTSPAPMPSASHLSDKNIFSSDTAESTSGGAGCKPSEQGKAIRRCISAAAHAVTEAAEELDEMDSRVGDGDCGSTFATAAAAILEDASSYPMGDVAAAVGAVGESIGRAAGGTTGGLYHVMLAAASAALLKYNKTAESSLDNLSQWVLAAEAGVQAVRHYGGASTGDRTMLDALQPAAEALKDAAGEGMEVPAGVRAAAKAAAAGAESTKTMSAAAGRSSYVPQQTLKDTADPGAYAVGIWLTAVSKAMT